MSCQAGGASLLHARGLQRLSLFILILELVGGDRKSSTVKREIAHRIALRTRCAGSAPRKIPRTVLSVEDLESIPMTELIIGQPTVRKRVVLASIGAAEKVLIRGTMCNMSSLQNALFRQ
jgi:hypothetical protein